jgi:hypothetical protein
MTRQNSPISLIMLSSSVLQAAVWKPLPSLIFGSFATVAGFCYILMPETLGHPLTDTIEQAENIQRRFIHTKHR